MRMYRITIPQTKLTMKSFNSSESFIVSEDIAGIIDPGSLISNESEPLPEYFCYLREELGQEYKCRISEIEKFADDSIEIKLKASETLIASLLSASQLSEVDIKIGEKLLFSLPCQSIITSFSIKFSSGNFHTVALTICQSL
jgi:hypothetical protein